MAAKKAKVRPQHESVLAVAGSGAGAVFRRIGTRIGILDMDSPEVEAVVQVASPETDAAIPNVPVSPLAQEPFEQVTEAAPEMPALRQELESLSRGLAEEATTTQRL